MRMPGLKRWKNRKNQIIEAQNTVIKGFISHHRYLDKQVKDLRENVVDLLESDKAMFQSLSETAQSLFIEIQSLRGVKDPYYEGRVAGLSDGRNFFLELLGEACQCYPGRVERCIVHLGEDTK